MAKRGRPIGTTRAAGYKVSPGRPRKKKKFFDNIVSGIIKLLKST
jgi:hypothetical protein